MNRREFLRNTAVVTAGLALPKVVLSSDMAPVPQTSPTETLGFIARPFRTSAPCPDLWREEIYILHSRYVRRQIGWMRKWCELQYPTFYAGYIDATRCPMLCRGIQDGYLNGLDLAESSMAVFTADSDRTNLRITSSWWDVRTAARIAELAKLPHTYSISKL